MALNDTAKKPPLSILLVEDHVDTAAAIRSILSAMGHEVRTAGSVEAAVREVVGSNFDLIVSDISLPDGNGISLIHGIRPFCSTPAIAVTAYGSPEDIARCKRAGFDLHLTKPVGFDALENAVAIMSR